jgi:hypothetical protein
MMEMIKNVFALNALKSLFCNDEHSIVSKRGWEVINEKYNNSK